MTEQQSKRVLIVEDDRDVRLGLGIRLEQEFEILFAMDGITAMRLARMNRPDVIVLDLGLPAGDGFKVLDWLRDLPELVNTPVLVLTGEDREGVEQRCLGLGAAAFMRKPADDAELVAEVRRLAASRPERQGRVLVVEDDDDLRRGLDLRLQAGNYDVVSVGDGMAAVAAANQHQPDVVLLDLGLPGEDGYWTLDHLQADEELARIPVIVLSGRDPEANVERAINAGAAMFLEKPANEHLLLDAIGAVMR